MSKSNPVAPKAMEFAKPQRWPYPFAAKDEGKPSCPPSIFMAQFRVLALKDTCASVRFVDSSSHSFTAVFRMNRPSQGNVFLHSVGNMYGTNAALVRFEYVTVRPPSAADRDDANGSRRVVRRVRTVT